MHTNRRGSDTLPQQCRFAIVVNYRRAMQYRSYAMHDYVRSRRAVYGKSPQWQRVRRTKKYIYMYSSFVRQKIFISMFLQRQQNGVVQDKLVVLKTYTQPPNPQRYKNKVCESHVPCKWIQLIRYNDRNRTEALFALV